MFNKIIVDYYGAPTPLQQLASFQHARGAHRSSSARTTSRAMRAIEKAIRDSDLGVNPTNDGTIIRCVIPQLTEERRREYVKVASTKAEDARVSVRNIRRTAKDDAREARQGRRGRRGRGRRAPRRSSTTITKKHVDQIDELLKHKEAELLEV